MKKLFYLISGVIVGCSSIVNTLILNKLFQLNVLLNLILPTISPSPLGLISHGEPLEKLLKEHLLLKDAKKDTLISRRKDPVLAIYLMFLIL